MSRAGSLFAVVVIVAAVGPGCGGPSATTSVRVGEIDFAPQATLYAQFEAALGGVIGDAHTERFARAIAFDGDIACADIDAADCNAVVGGATNRIVLDVLLDESLFGPARLGDYSLADGSSWELLTPDGKTFGAESGKLRLDALDDDRFAADYTVVVGGVEIAGALVGERCAALDAVFNDCD